MQDLRAIFDGHLGKVSDKWSAYWPVYEDVMRPFRASPIALLEIGVQNGGSLEIWAQYFEQASHIVGCDIDPKCGTLAFDDPRISVVLGDAAAAQTYAPIDDIAPEFDIIIDDGSHHSDHIVQAFSHLFPRLKDGGVYICEDLHASYFAAQGGGLERPDSALAFFRRLCDYVNVEHWNGPNMTERPATFFAERFDIALPDDLLSHAHEVRFTNSMCIVQKRAAQDNSLGLREFRGEVAAVNTDILTAPRMTARECVEMTAQDLCPPAKSLERRAHETNWEDKANALSQEIAALRATLAEREAVIERVRQIVDPETAEEGATPGPRLLVGE